MNTDYEKLRLELADLKQRTLKQNGQARTKADPEDLARIDEIEGILKQKQEQDRLDDKKLAAADGADSQVASTPGIPDVSQINALNPNYQDPRTTLDPFKLLEMDPAQYSLNQRVVLEKTLRKYVKRGGPMRLGKQVLEITPGFKKGLSDQEIAFAQQIMKALGRTEPVWDLDLLKP